MPSTTPFEHIKAAFAHQRECSSWQHRLMRRLLVNRTSRWNRWMRDLSGWFCDEHADCTCRICREG